MTPLWHTVERSLNALDWHRHGLFCSFLQGFYHNTLLPAGTLVLNNERGSFLVDDDLLPVDRVYCNRLVRMDLSNAQKFALHLRSQHVHTNAQKDVIIRMVITDYADLWMIPLLVAFRQKYILYQLKADVTVLVQAGEVLTLFFTSEEKENLSTFKRMTMAQQELVVYLYCIPYFETDLSELERSNETLKEFFDGAHYTHIFEGINEFYYGYLRESIKYYRTKKGQRQAYAAFFHGKDKELVPSAAIRKVVHGAGRYQVRRRLCAFLYKPAPNKYLSYET
jgi:hypothetical protein